MSRTIGAVSGVERLALLTCPMDGVAPADDVERQPLLAPSGIGKGVMIALAIVAVSLRLGPTLAHRTLGGVLEYDDGVHLGAAIHLLAGQMPYRSFTFVQPPGIVVLLTPFAAFARLVGEADAMASIRVVMALLGAANALLCARCAAPWGRRAAVAAGVFYAVWPVVVVPERTVLLEPILTASVLGALLLLRRSGRWSTQWAGLLLGLAVTVKLAVLPLVLVLAVWLLFRRGCRVLATVSGFMSVTILLVAGPFVAMAPGNAWRMIVDDQMGRPRATGSVLVRLGTLDGNVFSVSTSHGIAPVVAILLVAAICGAARGTPRSPQGAGLYLALFAVALAEAVAAPDFYYHYGALAGGPAAVLAGVACARVSAFRSRTVAAVGLAIGIFVVCAFALISSHVGRNEVVQTSTLDRFLSSHPCAMAESSLLIAGNDDFRAIRMGCTTPVDAFGMQLDLGRHLGQSHPGGGAQVQAVVLHTMATSDGAVLQGPPTSQSWSPATIGTFERRFREWGRFGIISTWVLRGS